MQQLAGESHAAHCQLQCAMLPGPSHWGAGASASSSAAAAAAALPASTAAPGAGAGRGTCCTLACASSDTSETAGGRMGEVSGEAVPSRGWRASRGARVPCSAAARSPAHGRGGRARRSKRRRRRAPTAACCASIGRRRAGSCGGREGWSRRGRVIMGSVRRCQGMRYSVVGLRHMRCRRNQAEREADCPSAAPPPRLTGLGTLGWG